MHPEMHTNAYMHTEQAGGLQNWLYRWTLYSHTGALVRKILAKDVGLSEVEIREILK